MVERRKHPRLHIQGAVPVLDLDRNLMMGQLVDISEDGLMVLCPELVDVRANRLFRVKVQLEEECCGGPLTVAVESLWREPGQEAATHWVGFKIIDIAKEDAERLHHLLETGSGS
jgi:hypothetical protein